MAIVTKTKSDYHILLEIAKLHLNVEQDFTEDDQYIEQLIKDATAEAEGLIDIDIATTEAIVHQNTFYGSYYKEMLSNVQTIDKIEYKNDLGTWVEIPTVGYVERIENYSFDVTFDETYDVDALRTTCTTGFGFNKLPNDIHRAILLRIADYYDQQRGSMMYDKAKDTGAFERILQPYRKNVY